MARLLLVSHLNPLLTIAPFSATVDELTASPHQRSVLTEEQCVQRQRTWRSHLTPSHLRVRRLAGSDWHAKNAQKEHNNGVLHTVLTFFIGEGPAILTQLPSLFLHFLTQNVECQNGSSMQPTQAPNPQERDRPARLYQPSPTTSRKRFLTLCSSNSSSEDVPEDIPRGTHRLFLDKEDEELTIWTVFTRNVPSAGHRAHVHDVPRIQKGPHPFPARALLKLAVDLVSLPRPQSTSPIRPLPAAIHMSPKSGDQLPLDMEMLSSTSP